MIISIGETLLPEARAEITAAFGTPVINSFASTEGLMGSSAPGGDVLMFNSDMCIIELVDADNRPVGPGVPSAKVLVTNLYNLAQPLIRYELADSFVLEPSAGGPGHLLARAHGRADEVFHYQAGDLHPHVIRSVMLRSPEVADYQVRQTRTGIEADIIAARQRQPRGPPPPAGGGARARRARPAGRDGPYRRRSGTERRQRKAPALHPAHPGSLTAAGALARTRRSWADTGISRPGGAALAGERPRVSLSNLVVVAGIAAARCDPVVGGVVYAGNVSQRDVGLEQAYVSMLYDHLDGLRDRAAGRLAQTLRQTGGTPQARTERDVNAVMYTQRIAQLDAAENGLCFGRIDFHDARAPVTSGGWASGTRPTTTSRCCSTGGRRPPGRSTWPPRSRRTASAAAATSRRCAGR